jgi:hypothetical protein
MVSSWQTSVATSVENCLQRGSSAVGCSWAEDRVGVRQRGGRRRRRAAGRRRRSGRGGEEGRRIPSHPWQRDPRPPELPRLPFPRRGQRRERQISAQDSRVCINLAPRAVDRSGVENEDDGMGQFCLGLLRCVGFGMDGRSGASRQHVPCLEQGTGSQSPNWMDQHTLEASACVRGASQIGAGKAPNEHRFGGGALRLCGRWAEGSISAGAASDGTSAGSVSAGTSASSVSAGTWAGRAVSRRALQRRRAPSQRVCSWTPKVTDIVAAWRGQGGGCKALLGAFGLRPRR